MGFKIDYIFKCIIGRSEKCVGKLFRSNVYFFFLKVIFYDFFI